MPASDAALTQLSLHILRIDGERLFSACLRVEKLPCSHQHARSFDLRFDILRHQIGGAYVFAERLCRLIELHVGFRQLVARDAEFRVLLNRIAIFDDRLGIFLLLDVGVAAAEVLAFGHLRIFRTAAEEHRTGE